MYPKKFEDAVAAIRRLPNTGGKTAEKYAYAMMDWPQEKFISFIQALEELRNLKRCKVCGNLSDQDVCEICSDENRDHNVICVVASPKDVFAIEDSQDFPGVYHVLNGLVNTTKGILPDRLNIDSLEERVNDNTEEVILALDPTIEGETTAMYLTKLLEDRVQVTKLASGIPMGGKLDYTDARTLAKAFEGRRKS